MKLIREMTSDYRVKTRLDEATGDKRMFIEGVFLQGNIENRNKRVYSTEMLESKVSDYRKNFIEQKRAYGELGHPDTPTINGERVCMRITELNKIGDNFEGKALITNTPMGKIVEGIISDGGKVGVSSRGLGTVKTNSSGLQEVQNDFILSAVDVVMDPSAPDAFVEGIMEGKEWIIVEGAFVEVTANKLRNLINKDTKQKKLTEERKLKHLENFLSSIACND